MSKKEFKELCKAKQVKFVGYSGKKRIAYIQGTEANIVTFINFVRHMDLPFDVSDSNL